MSKNIYLERYAWPDTELPDYFHNHPDMIVVIPSFNEPNIEPALRALHRCMDPGVNVAILLVINEPENASTEITQQNLQTIKAAASIPQTYEQRTIHLQLPKKHAGVGLARKIGMDEAVRCFENQKKDGIIICYDADCTCSENYLQAIWNAYQQSSMNLGHLHYEHDLNGPHTEEIINYELYLRYYCNALRIARYPYAIQTLGSCITVRSSAYQKQGGMNRRKAGEDFYFIHKCMPLGDIGEINSTCICPSDRISDRVPFGTGHAINKYLEAPNPNYPTYHYQTFEDLSHINSQLNNLWKTQELPPLPESITSFYVENNFQEALQTIFKQAAEFHNFKQRYYAWWDGFRVLKFIHFCRDHYYQKIPLNEALVWLDQHLEGLTLKELNAREQLISLRHFDQQQNFYVKL